MTSTPLEIVAARRSLNLTTPHEVRAASLAALEEGFDAPTLRMLAGLTDDELDEAPRLLGRALAELGVEVPAPRLALLRLAVLASADVLAERVSPNEGARRIWDLTLQVPELHLGTLDTFIYAASEWDERPDDQPQFAEAIRAAARALVGDQ